MIDIAPDKDQIIRSLQELEFEYSQNNISRKAYISQKKGLNEQLETIDVADRIRRLQGKGQAEKPLDYWTKQEEKKKQEAEREELFQKYIKKPEPKGKLATITSDNRKTIIALFLVIAFFVGTGFGSLIMQGSSDSSGASMLVNESAFPAENTTNTTNTTKNTTLTKRNTTTTPVTNTPSETVTPNPPTNGT